MKGLFTNPHFLSLTGNVFASFIGFLSILLLARIFSPSDLGEWLLYVTAFTFADMLRSGLVQVAFIQIYTNSRALSVSGSAWIISLGVTALISFVCYLFTWIFTDYTQSFKLSTFILYIPILFFASLPYTIALWMQQAENKFNNVLYLRLFLSIPFFTVIGCGLINAFTIYELIQAQILCYLAASATAVFLGWTHIQSVCKANWKTVKALLQFGKYSTVTTICSNLLKSTDTFLISWYLGPSAVAAYNLPYKLIELIEIPLRSMVATSLPQLSAYSRQQNFIKVKQIFNERTGLLSIAIIPLAIFCFLYAHELIVFAGGEQYAASKNIFRVFTIYSLFLPLDRFIGVTLDSTGKPHLNLIKVLIMVVINGLSSVLVLELFNSAFTVAVVTVVTTCCGILFGAFVLQRMFPFSFREIFSSGYLVITNNIYKIARPKVS